MTGPFHYKQQDFVKWLKAFAAHLHTTATGNYLELPRELGKGSMFAMTQGKDMSCIVMDCTLSQDLTLCREPDTDFGVLLFFNQVEVGGFFRLRSGQEMIDETIKTRSNVFLSSTDIPLEINYSKGSQLKRVGIYFSPGLVRKLLPDNLRMHLTLYTQKGIRNVNRETINFELKSILDDIFRIDARTEFGRLVLQNRIWMLTEKFFLHLMAKLPSGDGRPPVAAIPRSEDMLRIQTVEKALTQADLDKFPSIEALSKMAMMSSTKLKAKFKEVYGMKLYEYYNRHRLHKAKDMIADGRTSIKEAAYSIGFSNLSNFSRAFKKEFGVLPGKIK